jgi:pimeloyl-ACP methyl ester carboxylesterase
MRMLKVISKDGTPIAFERSGSGPALILVDGALCYRAFGPAPQLAALLAQHFTVFTYDRRGRGESGDTAPYAVEREVEDIEALVREAGGSAYVYGISSGASAASASSRCTRRPSSSTARGPRWCPSGRGSTRRSRPIAAPTPSSTS